MTNETTETKDTATVGGSLLEAVVMRDRPPTPIGWSDTDWIKHLQEQEQTAHPLAGVHINQGCFDAAADAYEAEYHAAHNDELSGHEWPKKNTGW